MAKIGFLYDGFWPIPDFLWAAETADEVGLDSIWIAEHLLYRDSMVAAAAALERTHRMHVIPGPISPYTRHPAAIAMAALSLAESAGGRVGLHLGTGNPIVQGQMGIQVSHALSTIEECIHIIGSLCDGKVLSTPGGVWNLDQVSLKFSITQSIPLYLAAIRPQMLALARRQADGTVLSAAISPAFVRYSLQTIRDTARGQTDRSHTVVGFIVTSVNRERRSAYDQIRPTLAYMLRTPALAKDWELNGLEVNHAAILEAVQKGDTATASRLVSDRAIETLSASGTPSDLQDRLQSYVDAGIDLPVILPVGDLETKIETLRVVSQLNLQPRAAHATSTPFEEGEIKTA